MIEKEIKCGLEMSIEERTMGKEAGIERIEKSKGKFLWEEIRKQIDGRQFVVGRSLVVQAPAFGNCGASFRR